MIEARAAVPSAKSPLLEVRGLVTEFVSDDAVVRAVDGVSFSVARGEAVGIVGESGSGKSATALSILGLLPGRARTKGQVIFDGKDVAAATASERRRLRGRHIAMVFQDPMASLNPYLTIEEQLVEVCELHLGLSRKASVDRAADLLDRVGIADARARLRGYPHELSGGMRQRVMIAMGLLCNPELLILDEPTTALDVTIQAGMLDLLREICAERRLSIVLITHDLGVVAGFCDRVLVMYAGRVVESAPTKALFARPLHPYTRALERSLPRLDGAGERLESIRGMPPRLDLGPFRECSFAPRCGFVHDACRKRDPDLVEAEPGRLRRCVLPVEKLP
jgi:oligopeptide transport system ATP-binding protein